MHIDDYLNLVRRDWLTNGPLNDHTTAYIDSLCCQRYPKSTIRSYLGCLAHFSRWLEIEKIDLSRLDSSLIKRFLNEHLPNCTCPPPCYSGKASSSAALRHFFRVVPGVSAATLVPDPIEIEITCFTDYLTTTCGIAPSTRDQRVKYVRKFLIHAFNTRMPVISELGVSQLDSFFAEHCTHMQPASFRVICGCLRSYFRYRVLQGDPAMSLMAALPRIADWRRSTLPKTLSISELESFLNSFDCADPVGLRDYAIARCLVDLGLRGHEATYLTLKSVNWRNGTLTIRGTKSSRAQQLPLPATTGEAIAQYLHQGRPKTTSRMLFVRHRAPFDKPLGVPAIRSSMNRAFVRCLLRDRFCNTHVLRRTMATNLQRSGASVKEIADLLRHQSLDTASTYARVDLDRLRSVTLPWPGYQS
ncbi:tyrosine-type recombinase/integrase [Pelovirga terrestris]|uniref:Tyrosine-type recombinase/integrase n=1 Tax=Pelovirga terrestris TaxID=2771352 RepID=A0A8J6QYJ2_9BACT|nr:tyrosine-type recombinase/integrase [Pelovirga terrestris]MBD1401856.1 tyrosine-type recombinase/integrase [Pelovirga terrestris]